MKQYKWNIPTLFFLLTFLLGTVGVNISKVSCQRCQETTLHVMVIPQELPCPCSHRGCTCCQHACHKKCDSAKQEHAYYKVSGDWAISQYDIQFCEIVATCNPTISIPEMVIDSVKPFNSLFAYIDTSPPLELLCIFRC